MIDMKYKQYHITSNRYEYLVSKMKMADGKPVEALDANGHMNIVEQPIGHHPTLEAAVNCKTALYKQAGNSIPVPIFESIFKELI